MKTFSKYSGMVVLLLTIVAGFILTVPAYAGSCQMVSADNINWGVGRIASFNTHIQNNTGCPNGYGTTKGSASLNDIPANITSWGTDGVGIEVPVSVEGLANVKVMGIDGEVYSTNQLLVSLKVDFFPSQITLGDSIEITGNFANTPGSENINTDTWPGKVVNLSTGGFNQRLHLISWTDAKIVISTSNSGYFKTGVNTLKVYYGSSNQSNGYQSQPFDISISAPLCTSWTYSDWSSCSSSGNQTRSINSSSPSSCTGGSPVLSQSCTYTPPVPSCTAIDWSCANWGTCSQNSSQTRTCAKNVNCQGGVSSPATSQSCTYVAPVPSCISFFYSSWSECSPDGKQTRSVTSKYPSNCENGELPKTTQSCTYTPSCTADTWTCGDWNSCSLSGIQNRSCRKTFDCPNVETAPPTTDQYCEVPSRPTQQVPQDSSDVISNQDVIIKSTVKLLCPVDAQKASQGSGTIIDPNGTILTNKHVIAGTLGCLVGFISDFNDEPYFGERQIADIIKVSPNQDIAILKIRNPQNKALPNVDITKGNSNIRLGVKITTYGFPAKFGTKVTYTSGDFSGTDGNYIKTTAILEYGNSGGGAYLKDGTFIGIPSAVIKGELNALGYILSINTINSWLGNSSITYGSTNNNNYSRVSVLEDIDLNKLGALKLFIPNTDTKGNLVTPPTNQSAQKMTEQPQSNQTQKESTIIESTDTNPKINSEQNNPAPSEKKSTEKKGSDSSIKILEQRRSTVADAVQEMVKVAERNGGVGQEIKTIAQAQVQNQEKLETSLQKVQSRSGFAKFFVGPNYSEINNAKKLLEQNREQIKQLDKVQNQLTNNSDKQKLTGQAQLLEQTNQEIENSLDTAQKGFSLFGWMFRLFAK